MQHPCRNDFCDASVLTFSLERPSGFLACLGNVAAGVPFLESDGVPSYPVRAGDGRQAVGDHRLAHEKIESSGKHMAGGIGDDNDHRRGAEALWREDRHRPPDVL